MKKKFRNLLSLCVVFVLLCNIPAFAEETTVTDEYGNTVTETKIDIPYETSETKAVIKSTEAITKITKPNGIVSPMDAGPTHVHTIRDITKTQYNVYMALTEYMRNDYIKNEGSYPNVTYSKGEDFTISGSASFSVGVSAEVVEASLGVEVGVSKTYTASTTYSYPVPYGYAGRIVYRYSYDLYHFTCAKVYSTGTVETGPGSATSAPYNGYYTLQKYYIF